MDKRVIRVSIEKERPLYDELHSAAMNHTEYEGCYVTQYVEYHGDNHQMIGEFTLRDKED